MKSVHQKSIEQEESETPLAIRVVCKKKRNHPRIDIRICQGKCNIKAECKEFKSVMDGK